MEFDRALMSATDKEPQETLEVGPFLDNVMPQLWQWHGQGKLCALVTLVNIEGASPRPLGSQLALTHLGETAGLISGGCVEPALVLEAQQCIASGQPRLLRLGKDSDYFDLQLPCGSGIDVLLQPLTDAPWLAQLHARLCSRQATLWRFQWPSTVSLTPVDTTRGDLEALTGSNILHAHKELSAKPTGRHPGIDRAHFHAGFQCFDKIFRPRSRLVVVGQGAVYRYFLQLLNAFDVDVIVYSQQAHPSSSSANISTFRLDSPADFDAGWLDDHSALIILSHDHAWEVPILQSALATPTPYIAALGSRATHHQRRQALRDRGADETSLARIKGPAGIDIGAKTPPEIALAILAEWVERTRAVQ